MRPVLAFVAALVVLVASVSAATLDLDIDPSRVLGNCSRYNSATQGVSVHFMDKSLISTFMAFDYSCGLYTRQPLIYECTSSSTSPQTRYTVSGITIDETHSIDMISGCFNADQWSSTLCASRMNISTLGYAVDFLYDSNCYTTQESLPPTVFVVDVSNQAFVVNDTNAETQEVIPVVTGSFSSPSGSFKVGSLNLTTQSNGNSWQFCSGNGNAYYGAQFPSTASGWVTDFVTSGWYCSTSTGFIVCHLAATGASAETNIVLDLSVLPKGKGAEPLLFASGCLPNGVSYENILSLQRGSLVGVLQADNSQDWVAFGKPLQAMYSNDPSPSFNYDAIHNTAMLVSFIDGSELISAQFLP
jgi:hypothetical protein